MHWGFAPDRAKRRYAVGLGLAAVLLCGFSDPVIVETPTAIAVETPLVLEIDAEIALDDTVFATTPEIVAALIASGRASYYADKFHGRRTASGEVFNNAALTAAHRSLPMGSLVRVTCEKTGRSVTVRVNDRGPFSGNRVIDVSKAAARELGMLNAGLADVTLEVLTTI